MKIAIYGAGAYGQYIYNEISENKNGDISVLYWIDNFVKENIVQGLNVYTEEEFFVFFKVDEIDAILVAVRNRGMDLTAQKIIVSILGKGYNQIYVALPQFFKAQLPVFNQSGGFSSFVKFYKDILPTERLMLSLILNKCNLNCKSCQHGSNLVHENDFLDMKKYESYLRQLKKKFRNIIEFQLLGGEPLLNTQLELYIVLARRYFPSTRIVIVTNGLAIPQMSLKLTDTITECDASFYISQYPPTRDKLEQIIDFLDNRNINYEVSSPRVQFRKWVTTKEESGEKAFARWKGSDCICHVVDEGRIYLCPCLPRLYAMRDYLNIQIDESELMNSSIDLMDDAIDGWDILNYYEHATSLCRFCSPREVLVKWEVGQSDKMDYFAD